MIVNKRAGLCAASLVAAVVLAGCPVPEEGSLLVTSFEGDLLPVLELIPADFLPAAPGTPFTVLNQDVADPIEVSAQANVTSQATNVEVDELSLSITSDSPTTNWDWLDSITVTVTTSGGAYEYAIGSLGTIPDGQTTLNIQMAARPDNNLLSVVQDATPMQFRIEISGTVPTANVRITGHWKIGVYR